MKKVAARIAIVGAGPSGFFIAKQLMGAADVERVDLFEKLFLPYGLVRYGVAPDHENTKRITAVFDKISDHEKFRFFGNIEVGKDISTADLKASYHAVVFTTGASEQANIDIGGDVISSSEFVSWYNGHPEFVDRNFDLSSRKVAIFGNGNVALDLCRMLAKERSILEQTDISCRALRQLTEYRTKTIFVLGRRGPLEAKFSNPELSELRDLDGWRLWTDPESLPDKSDLENYTSNQRANLGFFWDIAAEAEPEPGVSAIIFKFYRQPQNVDQNGAEKVLTLKANDAYAHNRDNLATTTPDTETITVGAMFKCFGNRTKPIVGLPFDDIRGLIPNQSGRVTTNKGDVVNGLYVAGWAKRGPSGTIGTNRSCATETAEHLLQDLQKRQIDQIDTGPLDLKLAKHRTINTSDWKTLLDIEMARGLKTGKPRHKITSLKDALTALEEHKEMTGNSQ